MQKAAKVRTSIDDHVCSWLSSTLGYISTNDDSVFQKLVPVSHQLHAFTTMGVNSGQ